MGRKNTVRRVLALIFALALLAVVPIGSAGAEDPTIDGTYTLYAGQDIPVGTLNVTNDTENLYVTFTMDADYCMMETHLQVGDLDSVQKRGNPIPGKFEYSADHDCVYSYMYTVPLGELAAGDSVDIAAHAKVKAPVEGCTDVVWQIGDVEEKVQYPDGSQYYGYTNYADEFNWSDAGPFTKGPGLSTEKPVFANPFVVGTNADTEFPYNSNASTANFYATDFDAEWYGALPFGGELYLSWSPGQSAQETKVVSGEGFSATFNRTGKAIPGEGYFLNTYPVYTEGPIAVGPLGTGTHTINFLHTEGDGTFWDWIRLERPCETSESAWSAGTDFPGRNWATYSTYEVQPVWHLFDSVFVPSSDDPVNGGSANDVVWSTYVLPDGVEFVLAASGTYYYASSREADAKCSDRGGTTGWVPGDGLSHPNYLEVWVNDAAFPWWGDTTQPCDSGHEYTGEIAGADAPLSFTIYDACVPGGPDGCYGDNRGGITVEIWGWLYFS